MMVTMFSHEDDPLKVVASTVISNRPGVCLSMIDGRGSDLTLHLDSPGELIAMGEHIVGEGMRLMREAALADRAVLPEPRTPMGRTAAEVMTDRAAFNAAMGVDDPL